MAKSKEKLIIIDGNALVHRSFHALPQTMQTRGGEATNAVYGFAAALIKAVRELRPEYVVLAMDARGPTFRHKKFKAYKAKRVRAPQELYDQIPRVKELSGAFDIPVFEKPGFEADDLIGTIADQAGGGVEKIILTGDQDTLQLVDEDTSVYAITRGVADTAVYDRDAVRRKLGVDPEQVVDYKALRGDPSDNIPGVRGVGEKTAVELLKRFGSLDRIYKEVKKNSQALNEAVKPRIIGLLKEHENDAYLSRELATIKRDVPIKFDLKKTRFRSYDQDKVVRFLSDLEFRSLLPRVQSLGNSNVGSTREEREARRDDKFERNREEFNYRLVDTDKKFEQFLAKLKKQKNFTYDTETSSFDPITSDLLGISFSWKEGEAYYVNFRTPKAERRNDNLFNYKDNPINKADNSRIAMHPWLDKLRPVFEDEKAKKCAHNAKFDIRVLRNRGIDPAGVDTDTMIASYLLSPGTRQHSLDAAVFTEFNFEKISKNDLLGTGRDKQGFSEVDTDKLMLYSCEDADFTERLKKRLLPRLKEKKLDKLYEQVEMPLIPVLALMEDSGVRLDTEFLKDMNKRLNRRIRGLEKKIHHQAGAEFNISSTQQLQRVLFDKLEIPTEHISKTKTGISTAGSELDKLEGLHPIIKLIQEYRELSKLQNTYVKALPELINAKTGRLHTSFNQTITATGRLSSTEPNLQNIPIRTELGREIRQAFRAERGYSLVGLDYSQIELRLAAHYSGDKKMIQAFREGADIHTATAAEINRVSPEAVSSDMRREAKAINFGLLYGQGPRGLSRTADIPYERAREFIEHYFQAFARIKEFVDSTVRAARDDGYVTTLMGRIRPLPEINSTVTMVRKSAERMAINTPLQGTAADMIKTAMVRVNKEILDKHRQKEKAIDPLARPVRLILTVHDELVFEVKNDLVEPAAKEIKEIMENVIKLKVPVVVDIKAGKNWGQMKELSI